jgi:hypothetical protein
VRRRVSESAIISASSQELFIEPEVRPKTLP